MVDANTAKYLNDNIGEVLSKALAEMSVQQPNDGVEFIAQWLKNYAEQEEMKLFREAEEKQVAEDRALTQKNLADKAARREKKVEEKKSVDDGYKALLDKFNNTEIPFDEKTYWSELVSVAKQYMGAQSVYLGLLDEEGLEDVEAPLIRYTHENIFTGSPSLLDKILPKMRDAETNNLTYNVLTESIPEEEHAAKCLWKPPPPPQEPVPEGEEPPPPPEGPKYLPVSVPCVTDVPIVHYFEMPRLGAYAAFPLVYPTYYTQEAFTEAKRFEEEKAEDLRVKLEKEAERAALIAEAQEKGTEEPTFEEEEPAPEKVMTLPGTTSKMVLCMDTLGTNTLFDEAKYEALLALCEACAECKARSEIKEIDDQALFSIGTERRAAVEDPESETGLPKLREDAKNALLESQEAAMAELAERGLEPDPKKAQEDILQKKFVHQEAKALISLYQETIKTFIDSCFTVSPEVLNIFAAIVFLLGYKKAEVYPPRKTMMKWPNMKTILQSDEFYTRVENLDLEIGKKDLSDEQKLTYIQSLIPAEFNEEKAKEIDPAFEVLWTYFSTATDYRLTNLRQFKADYDAKKKAHEENEDPEKPAFEDTDPAAIDDDFEGLTPAAE